MRVFVQGEAGRVAQCRLAESYLGLTAQKGQKMDRLPGFSQLVTGAVALLGSYKKKSTTALLPDPEEIKGIAALLSLC